MISCRLKLVSLICCLALLVVNGSYVTKKSPKIGFKEVLKEYYNYRLIKLGTLSPSREKSTTKLAGDVFYRDSDDSKITVVNFLYPDPGPNTVFWVGETGDCDENSIGKNSYILTPGKTGTREYHADHAFLPSYHGNEGDVILRLPEGVQVKDLAWLCIWCKEYEVKYGSIKLKQSPSESSCSKVEDNTPCDFTAKYRSFSGRCNNLLSPNKGMASTLFHRLLPSEYEDGISSPRSSTSRNSPLPNPREVSLNIHTSQTSPDPQFTLALMQWGQFVDHDLARVPIPRGVNNSVIDCRDCKSAADHPSCYPILIPKDDPTFPPHSCMSFTRSSPGQDNPGPREHMNQVTHYLDGSVVYGNNLCESEKVREGRSFLLRTSPNTLSRPGNSLKDLLPLTGNVPMCKAADGQCFLAGDERVNEHPGLSIIHTVLLREHNYIASELNRINPHWGNEKVFQETRKITSAIIQHITYNEFLPRVMGPSMMKKYSLEVQRTGYFDGYTSDCSLAIFNEFSTAAFRFGHSMISPNLTMMTEEDLRRERGGEQIQLRNHFNNPDLIRSGRVLDDLVRGLVMAPMEVMDNGITQEVKDHLFEEKNRRPSGRDLAALNIQRGRDHGLPGYNKFREFCGLNRSRTFHFEEIPKALVNKLHGVYEDPDDVDLFPGLLAENKLPGAIVGPTLACMIGLQFRYLRSCDRFWYESPDPMVRFTEDQLQAIRAQTLSGLLCRNCDQPGRLPMSSMDKMEILTNPMTDCKDLSHLDLGLWREGRR